MTKEKIVSIEIIKDSYYYLKINGKRMPELYNETEIIKAIEHLIHVWSNK